MENSSKKHYSVLLSNNVNEYVQALIPFVDSIHVVDNAQRVPVIHAPNVSRIDQGLFDNEECVKSYILKKSISVIYTQGRKSLVSIGRVKKNISANCKVITTCHNGYVWRNALKSVLFLILAARMSDGVIFLAKKHYEKWRWLCNLLRLHAWYLPNPVDVSRFPRRVQAPYRAQINLGSIGALIGAKGQAVTLKALHALVRQNYDVVVRFVGSIPNSEYKHELDRMVKEWGLESRVEWLGVIDYKNIPSFLSSIDIYVCSSFCEVMPFSILEAMASGLPVVASDVGGIPDIVLNDTNGFVVEAGRSDKFAEAIKRIIDDNLFKQFGCQGRHLAESRFSCKVIGPVLQRILFGESTER